MELRGVLRLTPFRRPRVRPQLRFCRLDQTAACTTLGISGGKRVTGGRALENRGVRAVLYRIEPCHAILERCCAKGSRALGPTAHHVL